MVNKNKFINRMTAREEVIADSIEAIRKRIIQIDFEVEFANSFLAENPDYGTEEAKAQLLQGIELMNSEKIYLISKLKFFKQKRTDLTAKKAMRGYDRFPKAVSMDDMVEIKEEEK